MSVEEGRLVAAERRIAGAMGRRLVDELAAARSKRRLTPSGLALVVLATLVHAVSLTLLVVGGWLVLTGATWPLQVLGGFSALLAISLAPRFPRAPKGPGLLDETCFPETAALVREVATVVGSPLPTRVQLDEEFNASAGPAGFRGRTMTLGAPLWVALSPQGKVALLAHELGHFAHGDILQLRYVSSAFDAIEAWVDIFTPTTLREDHMYVYSGPDSFWGTITWPVRALLGGYLRLMTLANGPAGRRQEHYADLASVRAAGTDGAVDCLEILLAAPGIEVTCNRVGIATGGPPIRPALEEYVAGYDSSARRRNRAHAATEKSSIDQSHPPTHERLRLVESVERTSAAVVVDTSRSARLNAELAEPLDAELARLAESYRGS